MGHLNNYSDNSVIKLSHIAKILQEKYGESAMEELKKSLTESRLKGNGKLTLKEKFLNNKEKNKPQQEVIKLLLTPDDTLDSVNAIGEELMKITGEKKNGTDQVRKNCVRLVMWMRFNKEEAMEVLKNL